MLLVVIATISKDLKPNARLKEEVEWIEMALRAFAENLPAFVSPHCIMNDEPQLTYYRNGNNRVLAM
jgi:hypothetical protein